MKKQLLAVVLAFAPLAFGQSSSITATQIQDLSGTLLASGYYELTPVNSAGRPTAFTACGGGQVLPITYYWPITNGAISGVSVPDTSCTTPSNVGYMVIIADKNKTPIVQYQQPIHPTGSPWSFDAWSPTTTVLASPANAVQSSTVAPTGPCTEPSLFYYGTSGQPKTLVPCDGSTWGTFSFTGGSSYAGLSVVSGVLIFTGSLQVDSDASFGGNVAVEGDFSVADNSSVTGTQTVGGTSIFEDDATFDGDLFLSGESFFGDDAFFGALIHTQLTPSSVVGTDSSGILEALSKWPIALGGTNATTAGEALSNLLGNPDAGTFSIACSDSTHCATTSASGSDGSGLDDPGQNGIVVRTSDGATTARTLQPTANSGCTWTNPTGVAGNPTLSCTLPSHVWREAAYCNGSTTGPGWDMPSSNAPVPACLTGTHTNQGTLNFADGEVASFGDLLPSDWTGPLTSNIIFSSSSNSGTVIFTIATSCSAIGATDDAAFNTANAYATVTLSSANVLSTATATLTTTGCAAGDIIHYQITRATDTASDTAVAVRGVEFVYERVM